MSETPSAADLIEQADAATTTEELDAIEAQAEGRVTVLQAVSDRRAQLAGMQNMTETGSEAPTTATAAPIVDPSPHAAPIQLNTQTLEELMAEHQVAASSAEVLALEPNDYESATTGPDSQISQTGYVEMTKLDGTTCLVPLSNVPYYEWKGYTRGADINIPDLVAYQAERARTAP